MPRHAVGKAMPSELEQDGTSASASLVRQVRGWRSAHLSVSFPIPDSSFRPSLRPSLPTRSYVGRIEVLSHSRSSGAASEVIDYHVLLTFAQLGPSRLEVVCRVAA